MAFLKREQIKSVVSDSLNVIAGLPSDVESSTFTNLTSDQKHIFLTVLKSKLNALLYNMDDGSTNHLAYYDVDLMPDSVDTWGTVKDCINWMVENQKVVYL